MHHPVPSPVSLFPQPLLSQLIPMRPTLEHTLADKEVVFDVAHHVLIQPLSAPERASRRGTQTNSGQPDPRTRYGIGRGYPADVRVLRSFDYPPVNRWAPRRTIRSFGSIRHNCARPPRGPCTRSRTLKEAQRVDDEVYHGLRPGNRGAVLDQIALQLSADGRFKPYHRRRKCNVRLAGHSPAESRAGLNSLCPAALGR